MGAIISIGTANPEYLHRQEEIKEFMMAACSQDDFESRQKISRLHSRSNINSRYSVLSDYTLNNKREFYSSSINLDPMPGVSQRMSFFKKLALPLSLKAIDNCFNKLKGICIEDITHLIVVTCTGLSSPGLDVAIIKSLKLNSEIERHTINFMGCYAAIQALKLANHICNSNNKAKILLVATELCTLHFQNKAEDDHLISNSLFSDGSAAVLIFGDDSKAYESLKLESFFSTIISDGENSMGWDISESGFIMSLKPEVPEHIKNNISFFMQKALSYYHKNLEEIKHWAIHPGGKKILEVIGNELGLSKERLKASYTILNNYGNMSSPSLLFVMEELWEKQMNSGKKELGLMMAFGPGLTIESSLFSSGNV